MEGPSLLIVKEDLLPFVGRKVKRSSGLAKVDHKRIAGKTIIALRTWGKHFLIEFDGFSLRIHFLMFGSYRINDRKDSKPRLTLNFVRGGEVNIYASAVTVIDEPLDEVYDWSEDVLSDDWDPAKVRKKLKRLPDLNVSDALLDQDIFPGVGNIIKNEVLFRIQVHPKSLVGSLPPRVLTKLINEARNYSFDFYKWRKNFELKKHWQIYTKKKCPRCKILSQKEYIGQTKRRTFFCDSCQVEY